jgi:hypothetical protein
LLTRKDFVPGLKFIAIAAGLALAFTLDGHAGVTSRKTLKLPELADRAQIIVLATPLKPFLALTYLRFQDSLPYLERRSWCFKSGGILKNADGAEIPEILMVMEANTASAAQAYALAHSGGEVESPATYAYAGSLTEEKMGKEESVLLFLMLRREKGVWPTEWFELSASQGIEKVSKSKTVAKLLPKPGEPAP